MKTFFKLILLLLGFPPAATEAQLTEILVTMREARDCHNAMVANLCKVAYKIASRALFHWNLPWFFESPLISNPVNVVRAIRSLGFDVRHVVWEDLKSGTLPPGKVGVLVHMPDDPIRGTLMQHWVVWHGIAANGKHKFHWGQKQALVEHSEEDFEKMFKSGWPDCAFVVSEKTV